MRYKNVKLFLTEPLRQLVLLVFVASNFAWAQSVEVKASSEQSQVCGDEASASGAEQDPADQSQDPDGWIVSVGDRLPSLKLVDPSGTLRSLDEFLGRPVVLLFWGSS